MSAGSQIFIKRRPLLARNLLLLCVGALFLLTVAAQADTLLVSPTRATVIADGKTIRVETQATTVAQLLSDIGITYKTTDRLTPPASAAIREGVIIKLERGSQKKAAKVAPKIAVMPKAKAASKATRHSAVTSSTVVKIRSLPFGRKWVADRTVLKGKKRVITPGRAGKAEDKVQVTRKGGAVVSVKLLSRRITVAPIDEVIGYGVKSKQANRGAKRRNVVKTLNMQASAYWADFGTGRTASGVRARRGVVAVDPAVIPIGTRLYIKGYGNAVAADTGGSIKGNRIDLCFATYAEARQFGRRTVTVQILK